MTIIERTRAIHAHLYSYRADKRAVAEYTRRATHQARKMDSAAIRNSTHSDPAARGGMMLAEPPKHIRDKMDWVAAVEDAWAECVAEDNADGRENLRGMAYVMEQYFRLTAAARKPDDNAEARAQLCEACGISRSTFYEWQGKIAGIVAYHAARRHLI